MLHAIRQITGAGCVLGAVSCHLLGAAALGSTEAKAQDFKPFTINVVGNIGNIPQTMVVERPTFTGLPEKSGGKITVRFRTFQDLGMNGSELLRLTARGDFDVASLIAGYISGDAPFFMGVDVPGLAPTLDDAQKQAEVYRAPLEDYMANQHNVKLLTVFPSPLQILYCRDPVTNLGDLKGRRIRVHATVLATLVERIGGIAVSIPYAEVYTSLQRGVADCAATSSTGGNLAKWFEVSKHLVTLPLGWAISAHVANKRFWDGLEPGARAYLEKEMKAMEGALWDLARDRGNDGLNCNMGGPCKYGVSQGASMTLYKLTEPELAKIREVVAGSVLVNWAKDCSAVYQPCVELWNRTVGQVTGVVAK
jgi:TRAP-type C4-dicarboxylate transport system substrate-binding protein